MSDDKQQKFDALRRWSHSVPSPESNVLASPSTDELTDEDCTDLEELRQAKAEFLASGEQPKTKEEVWNAIEKTSGHTDEELRKRTQMVRMHRLLAFGVIFALCLPKEVISEKTKKKDKPAR